MILKPVNGELIYLTVIDRRGIHNLFTVPIFNDLTLSDLIKRLDGRQYNCNCSKGNCRSCHIKILVGGEKLPVKSKIELTMLSKITNAGPTSRIACQVKIKDVMNGVIINMCH
ncbi:MAG: hypothetical protein C0191_04605 [Mucilaginibacter sp.]|nr:MAG: hypothetical protein C0191_04605 [Mucilaginibacter sp.]HEK22049.1 2Fe-2S iron-sulfur cluster binding domain-containing protein [Bacteroidota bacterium]